MNVKGVAASAATGRIYISTIESLMAFDLVNEQMVWERDYANGCDRMSMSPDGSIIYQPSFEKDDWYVLDAPSGNVLSTITPRSRAHNTVYGIDGRFAYLAGLASPWLTVADTQTHTAVKKVGPFSHSIRPFTVNGDQSLVFVNVNQLLGFEVGDLRTGKKLYRVEVEGVQQGPVKRHGCPSHGIAMTPDEREIWVSDAANRRVHIFDATVMPPRQVGDIRVRDEPGWITFSIDGTLAWPSTGDIIDVKSRKVIGGLIDENGVAVQSEKLLEIDFRGDVPVRSGDQFGVGRAGMPVREVSR
jgi:hypothetical protein